MSTLPGLEPIAAVAGFSPLDMLRVRGRRAALKAGIGTAVVVLAVVGVDRMTVNAQKPATCEAKQVQVQVPRPHIWPLSVLPVTGTPGPALRDVMARTHPEYALTAIVKANPGLASGAMGYLPRVPGGRACITLPAVNTAQQSAQVLVLPGRVAAPVKSAPKAASGKPLKGPYAAMFTAAGTKYGVDPALLSAQAWQESRYHPNARSSAGALGISQLMPATARRLKVDPLDPAQAIDGQAREMASLLHRYQGNMSLALAAYNAGPGAVARYHGIPPYAETRHYVASIIAKRQKIGA